MRISPAITIATGRACGAIQQPWCVPAAPHGRAVGALERAWELVRIALANVRFPGSLRESVQLAARAIEGASGAGAEVICFPECFVPGYRAVGGHVAAPKAELLEQAWSSIAQEAAKGGVAVVLGTERLVGDALVATALVINADGSLAGFQDKVQIDPSEEGVYMPGVDRRLFRAGPLTFGVVICHEGWRYPETVRAGPRCAARMSFFIPTFMRPSRARSARQRLLIPEIRFMRKAALCRAAENTCYFATVNYASNGSPTTSAIVNPDGTLLAVQPYGEEGLLIGDIDLAAATGLLASR